MARHVLIDPSSETEDRPENDRIAEPPPWRHTQLIIFLLVTSMLSTTVIGVALFALASLDIPDIDTLSDYKPDVTTTIYDVQGEVIERVFRENRYLVDLDKMPDLLSKAFVAAEDARFYQHRGVDFWSVLRAAVQNIRAGGRVQGGSTITQQVARSLLLSPEKTYIRKIREAILAYRIDARLTKDEILFLYLNQIYLGEGAYGVEAAALTYFGKSVQELDLAEIAMIAGLPQAPSRYSPFKHFEPARKRQTYVLNRMAEEGYITPTAAVKAHGEPLLLRPLARPLDDNNYFLQFVRQQVEKRYTRNGLYTGGLSVYTTLDQDLQRIAAASVRKGVEELLVRHPNGNRPDFVPQAALVCLQIPSGEVKAMIGGTSFAHSQFNRSVQAKRQPGSAFKPFIYATALARGFTPVSIIDDSPITLPGGTHGQVWEPKNYDEKFKGPTLLRTCLIQSRNVPTVRILRDVGLKSVISLAHQLGIQSPLPENLSLALGSAEITLLELTAAYAAFGNGGVPVEPLIISRIKERDGRVIETPPRPPAKPALDPRIAYQITSLLKGVIQEGTGKLARDLGVPAAGKTGTTDDNMDAWFIGYTPALAAGAWIGNDKKMSLGKGETGGKAAIPIWRSFMKEASVLWPVTHDFERPGGIALIPISAASGTLARREDPGVVLEAFREDRNPFVGREDQ